jgi:hypothetical protein
MQYTAQFWRDGKWIFMTDILIVCKKYSVTLIIPGLCFGLQLTANSLLHTLARRDAAALAVQPLNAPNWKSQEMP